MSNDVLTVATQNLVLAFNSLNKTQQYLGGQYSSDTYTGATTQVYLGKSRLVAVNIIVTGGSIEVYNTASKDVLLQKNLIFTLDSTAIIGNHQVGAECPNGIAFVVTAPTVANITYSVY